MQKISKRELILTKNIWSIMFKLSWAAILAMVLGGFNAVIDAAFIGRFVGQSALAGVSFVGPLYNFLQGLGAMVGIGAGSLLSILIGKNDKYTQKRLVGNTTTFILIISTLTMVILMPSMNHLLKFLGAKDEILTNGYDYIMVLLIFSPFAIGGVAYNMVVRSEGKMSQAALMMGIGLLFNIFFNYIFMVLLNYGVKGAAWATNIGSFVYVLLFFIYCRTKKATFETNEYKIYFDKKILSSITKMGIPQLLMILMFTIQSFIIFYSISKYSPTDQAEFNTALYGSIFRLFNFMLTPIYGLMRALQPAIGINFGAKKYDRAVKSYIVFCLAGFLIILPLWIVSMSIPTQMVSIMLPDVILSNTNILDFRIFMSLILFMPLVLTAMTFWPAINKPKPASIMGVLRQVVFYIPAMIILPKYFGVSWIYRGSFIIEAGLFIVTLLLIIKDLINLNK